MIDEQKVFGMLQAKALGCLDADDEKDLQNFIDEGYPFPWDEFGIYQNTVSLLPLILQLEIPDAELKDKVALKLIKLRDELRAQKSLEEEKKQLEQNEELIEEEFDENVEEFTNVQESYIEPEIEVEPEQAATELNSPLNVEEASFNLDEIVLPGFETTEISEPAPEIDGLKDMETEVSIENLIEEAMIETPNIEEMNAEEVWIEPEITQPIDIGESVVNDKIDQNQIEETVLNVGVNQDQIEETVVNDEPETKQVEETFIKEVVEAKQFEEAEDTEKHPDFTKKSVVEKMYKAIEQDFDSLKDHYEKSERKLVRGQLISYVVVAVLLALLIFLFFKFSSDINGLEKEIKDLKKNTSLIDKRKTNSDGHLFS